MKKIIFLFILFIHFSTSQAQEKSIKKTASTKFIHRLSLRGEAFLMYLLPNEISFREQEKNLGLNLRYSFPNNFSVGVFGTTMLKPSANQLFIVDKAVVNINTATYNVFGGYINYNILKESKVNIELELRLGIANSGLTSVDNVKKVNNNTFILNPRIYVGYDLTKQLEIGLFSGYLKTQYYLSGVETKNFEPNSSHVGAYIQLGLGK